MTPPTTPLVPAPYEIVQLKEKAKESEKTSPEELNVESISQELVRYQNHPLE